jgi:hypothetical protein
MHIGMLGVYTVSVVHLALLDSGLLGWIQAVICISTVEGG